MNRATEAAFEAVIEAHLLANGYVSVAGDGFDRERAIFPETVLAFVRETQPKEWAKLDQNEEIFVRFMNDTSFQKIVTAWMASEAYRRLRSDGDREGSEPADPDALPPRLRLVEPRPSDRYRTCVPLVPLKAAAGAFGDPQRIDDDDNFAWVAVETTRRLRRGMFVAQVVGQSMGPAISDGAYCLFAAPVGGSRQGKTVLVQMRDAADPESGERYTVKRYESEKEGDDDSWRHTRITLNPDFEPIVLTGADEDSLKVVAEVAEVLGGGS